MQFLGCIASSHLGHHEAAVGGLERPHVSFFAAFACCILPQISLFPLSAIVLADMVEMDRLLKVMPSNRFGVGAAGLSRSAIELILLGLRGHILAQILIIRGRAAHLGVRCLVSEATEERRGLLLPGRNLGLVEQSIR